MKAITIHQPFTSLIAHGYKRFETRSWKTNYRGPIAIHAGKTIDHQAVQMIARDFPQIWREISPLPTGCVIAVAELEFCWKVSDWLFDRDTQIPYLHSAISNQLISPLEFSFGDYSPGRYAWELANVRMIDPVPVKGRQGLWNCRRRGR